MRGQGVALPDGLLEALGDGVLGGVLDPEPAGEPDGEPDEVAVGLGEAEPDGLVEGLVEVLDDGLDEPPVEGLALVLPLGEPLGLLSAPSLGLSLGLPLGLPLGVGEPEAPPGVSGPCSASTTARICCSKAVSWAWIWSSGTEPMSWPKLSASAQISSICAVDSSLSGPSRVTKSCTAAEKVRQLVQS